MSVLFRRSTFFVDFKTMLAYSDLYVGERLIECVHENKLNEILFQRLADEFKKIDRDNMKIRLQAKTDVNFLLGYLNWDIVTKLEESDPVGFCNELYDTLLYQEYDKDDTNSPEILFTNLAETLRIITKDTNTEALYIYMDRQCDYLKSKITDFFMSSKIQFVDTDKKSFFKEKLFDSYFFEDVDDVAYIRRRHNQRSEVIIPSFPFNVEGYDITEEGEVIYSQDSFLKKPILDESPIDLLDKYNLDLALIDIPL